MRAMFSLPWGYHLLRTVLVRDRFRERLKNCVVAPRMAKWSVGGRVGALQGLG